MNPLSREFKYVGTLAAAVLAIWGAGALVRLDARALTLLSALITMGWLSVYLVRRILRARATATRDPKQEAAIASCQEMRREFATAVSALKHSPFARTVFTDMPWFLVIGRSGAGKTSALEESGVDLSTLSHALPQVGQGTAHCQWWFGERGAFLDTSGRYLGDPASRTEWLQFLASVRRARRGTAIHGIIVALDIADLIKKDDAAISTEAHALRDHLDEACANLDARIPVHLMLTKCDMIGGFKDFFTGGTPAERDAPWGAVIDGDQLGAGLGTLCAALRTRRLATLAATSTDDQRRKIFQFPAQFSAVLTWVQALANRMADRPSGTTGAWLLRSCHFTSSVQQTRPALSRQPLAAAPRLTGDLQASIFLKVTDLDVLRRQPPSVVRSGLFLREVFESVVVADAALAGPSARRRQRATVARWMLQGGIPACGAVAAAWMLISGVSAVNLVHGGKFPVQKVHEVQRAKGDAASTLVALDGLSYVLADVASHRHAGLARLKSLVSEVYYRGVKQLMIDPCGERLHRDIERLRTRAGSQSPGSAPADELYDVHRAYQMLGGSLTPDARLLERVLLDDRRWFSGLDSSGSPASGDADRFARQQLGFLLEHMGDTDGWAIACDRHLVEKVNFELGDALWLRQAYDDIINSLQGGFPTIRRDAFIFGPFRETLDISGDFSAIYSQKGWDTVLAGAIETKSDEIAQRFRQLRVDKSSREIRERLTRQFSDDFDQHWLGFLAGTRIAGLPDLAAVPSKLAAITGPQSPYREFVKEVWKAHHLQIVGPDLRILTGSGDLKWIDGVFAALDVLRKDVEKFLAVTDPRHRSDDLKKLQQFAEAVESAASACSAGTQAIESNARRSAAQKGIRNLLQSIVAALSNELLAEQNATWHERVVKPFHSDFAGRFPIDAAAAESVPLATFSRMFNPVSGSFWSVVGTIEDLRRIKAAGREFLPVTGAYESFLAKGNLIKAGFYPSGDRIAAPFTVTLQQREGVTDVVLTCGSQTFALYDRPDSTGQFVWKEGAGMDAKLSITIVTSQILAKDFTSQPWGIFRLIRAGEPSRRPDGSYVCSWRFPSQAVGAKAEFKTDAVLSGNGFERALVGDLFAGFACPEGIGP
ncbi:MAG: hypothetical protein H0V44_01420 [Planctomycetes bacterium]|nr:hypothetical protein [Planctomycetota bacterium]